MIVVWHYLVSHLLAAPEIFHGGERESHKAGDQCLQLQAIVGNFFVNVAMFDGVDIGGSWRIFFNLQ